jgi:hypothetical protein
VQNHISYIVLAHTCHGHVCDNFKKDPFNAVVGKLYSDKIVLLSGSQEETVSLEGRRISAIQLMERASWADRRTQMHS